MARKKIKTAVALTKESTVVIKARPMTMFFPFGTLAVQVIFLLFFLLLAAFLGTADLDSSHFGSGAVKRSSTFVESLAWFNSTMSSDGVKGIQDADDSRTIVQLAVYTYVLFGLLWTINCVTNTSWTAMSGSVSHWYFFRDAGDDSPAKTKAPLARSLGRVLWYHLGTIAFGSFVVAVIQLVRIILMAVDRYTKNAQKSNLVLWLALKCCMCCMWCLEKTVKYITGYAYIYVALQGSGFCSACFATFALIFSCPAQLAINNLVSFILKWIQLLSMPIVCAWLGNAALLAASRADPMYATVVIGLMALVIASIFSTVFGCVLDTLFVCCVRDKADYAGKYMPSLLREAYGFDKKKKDSDKDGQVLVSK
jgi:choline transporter-like protein 2/4/5